MFCLFVSFCLFRAVVCFVLWYSQPPHGGLVAACMRPQACLHGFRLGPLPSAREDPRLGLPESHVIPLAGVVCVVSVFVLCYPSPQRYCYCHSCRCSDLLLPTPDFEVRWPRLARDSLQETGPRLLIGLKRFHYVIAEQTSVPKISITSFSQGVVGY